MIKLRTLLIAAGFAFAGSVASAATLIDVYDGNDPTQGDDPRLYIPDEGIDSPFLYKCDDIEEDNLSCTDVYANDYDDGTFTIDFTSDDGSTGTWTWVANPEVEDPVAPHYFSVKKTNGWALYEITDEELVAGTGLWDTSEFGGGEPSHISFWNTGVPEIPLPAAGFLLLGGLGAFGFVCRRKG